MINQVGDSDVLYIYIYNTFLYILGGVIDCATTILVDSPLAIKHGLNITTEWMIFQRTMFDDPANGRDDQPSLRYQTGSWQTIWAGSKATPHVSFSIHMEVS